MSTEILSAKPALTLHFRPVRLWSRQMLFSFGGLLVGLAIGLGSNWAALQNPVFLRFMIIDGVFIAALIVGIRVWQRRRGGLPPIVFEEDGIDLPRSANSSRLSRLAYGDILSVSLTGKGKRASLLIDSKSRAFVFALNALADDDAFDQFMAALKAHVTDPQQWNNMTARQNLAARFVGFRALVTWSVCSLLAVVYLLQFFFRADFDQNLFSLLDFGANAGWLVFAGQWQRLATANFLHLSLIHLASNLVFLLIIGTLVERQMGRWRFCLLLLLTGLVSQAVSAGWMVANPLKSGVVVSLGASGALFGILGAQAVLNRLYASQLPGGYRFPARSWWILLGVNFVALPLVMHQIDSAAHVGGLLSGIVLAWLLCRRYKEITDLPIAGPMLRASVIFLACVYFLAAGEAALRLVDSDQRRASHAELLQRLLKFENSPPALDNAFAWDIAISPATTSPELDDAKALVERAISGQSAHNPNDPGIRDYTDTLATIDYRLGQFAEAVRLEQPLTYNPAISGSRSQMARFLDLYWHRHGPLLIGLPAILPELVLKSFQGHWSLDVTIPDPQPEGAEIYALVRQGASLRGMIRIYIAPGRDADQRSTWNIRGQEQIDQNLDANGASPTLIVAEFDRTKCTVPEGGANFYPFEKKVAAYP